MTAETHLLIIWQHARHKEDELLEEIARTLRIVEVMEVTWSEKSFSRNLSRFYGQKLPDRSFKEEHCGRGPFLLVVCEDVSPAYASRDTVSRDVEVVNTNLFDLKVKLREMTGGGHRIHATNSVLETNHDLSLLLGVNVDDYAASRRADWDGSVGGLARDLTGDLEWASLEEMFYILNACEPYVVLRNFDLLPDQPLLDGHDDIDFLAQSYQNFVFTINASRVFPQRYRVHHKIKIAGHWVPCDVRFVGDRYYDERWQSAMLDGREFLRGVFVPSDEDFRFGLLYHALLHKREVSPDYVEKLGALFGSYVREDLFTKLVSFLGARGYEIVEPRDLSVFFSGERRSLPRRLLYSYYNARKFARRLLKR